MPNPWERGMRGLGYAIFGDPRDRAMAENYASQRALDAQRGSLLDAQTQAALADGKKTLGEVAMQDFRLANLKAVPQLMMPTRGVGVLRPEVFQEKEAERMARLSGAVATSLGRDMNDVATGYSRMTAMPMTQYGNEEAIRRAAAMTGQASALDNNFAALPETQTALNQAGYDADLKKAVAVEQERSIGDLIVEQLRQNKPLSQHEIIDVPGLGKVVSVGNNAFKFENTTPDRTFTVTLPDGTTVKMNQAEYLAYQLERTPGDTPEGRTKRLKIIRQLEALQAGGGAAVPAANAQPQAAPAGEIQLIRGADGKLRPAGQPAQQPPPAAPSPSVTNRPPQVFVPQSMNTQQNAAPLSALLGTNSFNTPSANPDPDEVAALLYRLTGGMERPLQIAR